MLLRLSVENYALIEQLEMELSPSLNIITGETGAGKSILLGAMGLILGNRADLGVLKDPSKNCVIEGVFDITGNGLESFFKENDIDYENNAVIRRVITPAGKSRAYVNDIPVQLATLRELSLHLIDIHSQNQSELIGDENFRMRVIDSLAENKTLREQYSTIYSSLKEKERNLSRIKETLANDLREQDYIRFQFEQLRALGLRQDEVQELEAEQKELANAGEILSMLSSAEGALGDEQGALITLKSASQNLAQINKVFEPAGTLSERIHAAYVELKDIYSEITSLAGRIESNPLRLEAVDNKLGEIYSLMKKHDVDSANDLIALELRMQQALESMSTAQENIPGLEKELEAEKMKAVKAAGLITKSRKAAAEKLDSGVCNVLSRLGMPAAKFVTEISPADTLTASGADEVAFLFNANREARLQPLEKVASGGETSRVMLALKSIVARGAKLPSIIFDEIDTGVSGRIADVTGDIIAELGEVMQVVNITHLPQVASKGNTHFLVYKAEAASGIKTGIRLLDRPERVEEIAKMLSGSEITPAATAQAKALLGY